jgi:tRNA(Ile)-lysidine synthetase-like protein
MEAIEERLRGLVAGALTRQGVASGDIVLCAYSAGPDSTALAILLDGIASESGFELLLVHIDHGIRPETERRAERALALGFASKLGRELIAKGMPSGAVREAASRDRQGIESAARKYRYAALEEERLARSRGGRTAWIATGHTADDQDETVLMRILSGSGARGLSGIRERRGAILRPLLAARKRDLERFLALRGVSFSLDSTNASEDYLRNRIRHALVPALEGVFPGYPRALESLRTKAALTDDLLQSLAPSFTRNDSGLLSVDASAFMEAHPALRLRALEDAASLLSDGRRIPFRFLARAALQPPFSWKSGTGKESAIEGAGISLRRARNAIVMEERLAHRLKKGYFFKVSGPMELVLPGWGAMRLRVTGDPRSGPSLASFSMPAFLRSPRPHDSLRIMGGNKPLSALLNEWGMGPESALPPLLEDAEGIVCVFGKAIGNENRYAERGFRPGPDDTFLGIEPGERGSVDGHRG